MLLQLHYLLLLLLLEQTSPAALQPAAYLPGNLNSAAPATGAAYEL
jgi:hypothetical protein